MRNPNLGKIRRRLFSKTRAHGFGTVASRCVRRTEESLQIVTVRRDPIDRLCIELWVTFAELNQLEDSELNLLADLMTDHGSIPNLVDSGRIRTDFEANEKERVTIWQEEAAWDDYLQFMVDHRIVPFLEQVMTIEGATSVLRERSGQWAVLTSSRFRQHALGESVGQEAEWVWTGPVDSVDELDRLLEQGEQGW